VTTQAPSAIGPYRVLSTIGEGAFGDVYLAEQTAPVRRKVALKVVKLGMDTKQVVARFEAERQALAMMDHPNIASVHDAGTTETGRPYFAMEYVPGVSLTRYCDEQRLDTDERLGLFLEVCDAVQYAHEKGIIHRDIKPSNLLVERIGDRHVAKVIDFGIAKAVGFSLTERTLYTEQGQLVGTPEYMSPEQAELSPLNVDTRSDIYSLGVVLYELLVGTLPFDPTVFRLGTINEMQRRIREEEPRTPSTRISTLGADADEAARCRRLDVPGLRRRLRGDLDWITMKAMAKERSRRYASASELAADLERHLRGEAVLAGRPSTVYRVGKFVRRHKAVVGGVSVAFIALAAGTTVATWQAVRARAEAARAIAVKDFLGDMIGATDVMQAGRKPTAEDALDDAVGEIGVRFAGEPDIEADVRSLVGLSYRSMGEFQKSLKELRLARDLRESTLGERHPLTLEARHNVGEVLRSSRRWAEAEEVLRDVVEARKRTLGDRHPDTLWSQAWLASALNMLARFDEAETLAAEAGAGLEEARGEGDPRTLRAQNFLVGILQRNNKAEEAIALRRQLVETAQRTLGDEHYLTIVLVRDLAALYGVENRWEEAEPLARQSVADARRLFGKDDYRTLYWTETLGWGLYGNGQKEEGEKLLRQGLEGLRREFGDRHLWTNYAVARLAFLELDKRNYEEAEKLFRSCLDARRELLGENHAHTATLMGNLANCLHWAGKSQEAEALLRKSIAKLRQLVGDYNQSTTNVVYSLGILLQDRGKLADAEAVFAEALEGRTQVHGADHSLTLHVHLRLARIMREQDRYEEADVHYRRVVEGRRALHGPEASQTTSAMDEYAEFLMDWGKPEKAQEYRAPIDIQQDVPASD
jgi:hypothetical protein